MKSAKGTLKATETVAKVDDKKKRRLIPEIERPTGMYGGVLLSSDPKPFPKASPYNSKELEKLKEAMVRERDQLRRELASLEEMTMGRLDEKRESPGYPTHIAEFASDMQERETILGVRALKEERLELIEEAIQRIEEKKNYGLCLACGNKIGIERLIAKPHAHLCMSCRELYEKSRGIALSK